MKRHAALVLSAGALALSACQTTKTGAHYVKQGPGPNVEVAIAECKALSDKASHVVIGIGGPEVIVGALIGTAVATGIRRAQVFESCMTAQGYRKADAQTAAQAAPAPAAPVPAAKASNKASPKATKKAPARGA
jgi:hypothetical protein